MIVEDDEQLEKIRAGPRPLPEARARDPDDRRPATTRSRCEELVERGAGALRVATGRSAGARSAPDDICTFIYTSGTTGPPKGCVISHGNYRSMLDMVHEVNVLGDERGHLPVPAARALLRAADPARHLRPRRDARLLGARPAEDHPQPRRGEADLLPVGAADLREDLHRRHRRRREGGRAEEERLRLGDRGRQEGARGSSAPGKQPGACCCSAVRDRRQAGAVEDPRPVRRPAEARGHRRGADQPRDPRASSTPPASSCSRAGG